MPHLALFTLPTLITFNFLCSEMHWNRSVSDLHQGQLKIFTLVPSRGLDEADYRPLPDPALAFTQHNIDCTFDEPGKPKSSRVKILEDKIGESDVSRLFSSNEH